MTIEQLLLQAIDICLKTANSEQKRLYCWMKATLQYADIERFIEEVRLAELGLNKTSSDSLHKAIECVASLSEYRIRSMSISDKEKDDKVTLEKIRLREVESRMKGVLQYFGLMES